MKTIHRIIKLVINISAAISAIFIFIMMAMTVWDILGRRFFGAPVAGVYELTSIGLVIVSFTGIGLAQLEGENIGITILYDKLSIKVQSIFDFFISIISIALFATVFKHTLDFAKRTAAADQVTSVLRIPLYPWIYLTAFGVFILIIAFVGDIFDSIEKYKGDKINE